MICYGVPPVEEVRLFQNSPYSEIAGIRDEAKGSGVVREDEDRCYGERMDQGIKGGLACCCPIEWSVSLCELVQGMGDL